MSRILLLIGIGGGLGSIARYLFSVFFAKFFTTAFPVGTFVVNIIGSLIIGLLYGFSEKYNWSNPEWRLFLAVGFCGGFTTFSAFAIENIKLLQSSNFISFGFYSFLSFIFCLLFAFIGLQLSK